MRIVRSRQMLCACIVSVHNVWVFVVLALSVFLLARIYLWMPMWNTRAMYIIFVCLVFAFVIDTHKTICSIPLFINDYIAGKVYRRTRNRSCRAWAVCVEKQIKHQLLYLKHFGAMSSWFFVWSPWALCPSDTRFLDVMRSFAGFLFLRKETWNYKLSNNQIFFVSLITHSL